MENTSLTSWMAWTWPTAFFFIFIFGSIAAMGVWEYYVPGGSPRTGFLKLHTTRGDRLFISILGACFICLACLFVFSLSFWPRIFAFDPSGAALGIGLVLSLIWGVCIFRWA